MMRSLFSIVPKVLALTVILFVCYAIGSTVLGQQTTAQPPAEAATATLALLIVCLLNSAVMAHVIVRSRWSGWRLAGAVFVVFYGVTTFMSQIESAVFLTRLPAGMVPRLFLMGIVIAVPFSLLAVLILGKWKGEPAAGNNTRLEMPRTEWAWKLSVIAVVYVTLYFTFGYFIAWRNPELREYYAGQDHGGFLPHMDYVLRNQTWLLPFQVLRSLLWVAIALPVIRMLKGPWQEAALSVGLLFSVVMNAQLLLPNPFMPEGVRMTHLVETASSNLIFGLFVGWLLTHRVSLRAGMTAGERTA
jgi:hypothetical protein